MEFKDRIRLVRNKRGLSQTQLASELGKGESAVRMWEIGRSKPDADTLIKLSKYFGCTTDYLLGISDVPKVEYVDIVEKTKLSFDAVRILTNMAENMAISHSQHRVINFIIENAWNTQFLEHLYRYLFQVLFFTDPEVAASFKLPADAELYNQVLMVAFSEDMKEGRVTVKNTDLNDMYVVKIQTELMELRKIVEKRRAKEGAPNE